MILRNCAKIWTRLATIPAAAVLAGAIGTWSLQVRAGDLDDDARKVRVGLEVAPVPLKLAGKNRELVGLGSYIVNVQIDCNGCHTQSPDTEYTPSGEPVPSSAGLQWRQESQSQDISGRRPGFRPARSGFRPHHQPQLDTRQDRQAGRWPRVRRVSPDHQDRCRPRPSPSHLSGEDCRSDLRSVPFQRRPSAGHALARFSEHERLRASCRL